MFFCFRSISCLKKNQHHFLKTNSKSTPRKSMVGRWNFGGKRPIFRGVCCWPPVGRNDARQGIITFWGQKNALEKNRVPGTLAENNTCKQLPMLKPCLPSTWSRRWRRPFLGETASSPSIWLESSSLWMFMMYHEFIFQAINSKISNSPFWPNNIKKQYETREKKRQDTTQKRQKRNHLPGNSALKRDLFDMVSENVTLSKVVGDPPTFGDKKVTNWITWRILSTKYWLLNRDPYNGIV